MDNMFLKAFIISDKLKTKICDNGISLCIIVKINNEIQLKCTFKLIMKIK